MNKLRSIFVSAALVVSAGCSGGGGGEHVAPVTASGASGAANPAATSTMTITVERSAATSSAHKRAPQTIPVTALAVDARVWTGSSMSGSPVATSCVPFPANTTTATLTVTVPQGTDTIQIASWSQTCSTMTGGQGTTGTGSILSSFTGTGTVLPTSTDIGTVFNNGTPISLVTPTGGTGVPITGLPIFMYGYGPASLANAFQYPVQSGFDGTGMTVAIVIDSALAAGDLSTYLSEFGIPTTSRTITFEAVDSASTTAVTADSGEATLDLETIAGLAPGANIIVYVIPSLANTYTDDAYNQIISDGKASVVSSSFGGCEVGSDTTTGSTIFAAGAAAKIAFVASSGDQGSTCYDGVDMSNNPIYITGVNYPASDPNVIGVGGSETWDFTYGATSAALINPVAWDDQFFAPAGTYDGTGGGVSTVFTLPSYQSGVTGEASTTHRNVPDVAMPAEGVEIQLGGNWTTYGGTSWAAPLFAAQLAEVYEYCKAALANPPSLPYTAHSRNSSAFLDITSGNNYYPPVTTSPSYAAGPGYDNATGLGEPYGMPVAEALCPNRVPSGNVAAAAPAVTLGPAQALTVPVDPRFATLGSDQGQRAATDPVRVQLVLRPAAGIAANEQTIIGQLEAAGFTIVQTFSNHLVIDATGTTASVQQYFATAIHNVNQGTLGETYAPATSFTIPAAMAPYVAGANIGTLVNRRAGFRR